MRERRSTWVFGEDSLRQLVPADAKQNLRTQLQKIIKRAGVEVWPKLWQNLRATRATELADRFPAHVATSWCGHTEKVAMASYWQTTDEHFRAAVSGEESGADDDGDADSVRALRAL